MSIKIPASEDALILDIGTKDGGKLEDVSGTVVAIDISGMKFPENSKIRFALADGRQLPFKTNTFDYVHCSVVLEHVNGSGELIAEAARVLKPSGIADFDFPNRISLLRPHSEVPRYYSILPKSVGKFLAPYLLSEEDSEYYEKALFPLTSVTARRHLHANFDDIEYTMRLSGEMVSDSGTIQGMFRAANRIVTKFPFKYPYELLWPNASYRCTNPKSSRLKE